MKNRKISLFLALFLVPYILLSGCSIGGANLELTIVHTNDVHGRAVYSESDKIIGYSKINTYISKLKESNKNVMLMDAGDTLHGQTIVTVPKGQTAVDIMNLMGYNYFVPGNHDFNYGYERLIELSKSMNFKTLASNLCWEKDGSNIFEENSVFEVDGVKVGVFGLVTPETAVKTNPKNVEGLVFKDPVETAKEQVTKLKNAGAQLIILISHLGIDDESKGHRSYDVRDNVDGLDLIIDGHSHSTLEKIQQVEGKAVITSAGAYNGNLGVVTISMKNGQKTITPKNIPFSEFANIENSADIDNYIQKATTDLSPLLNEVVGNTEVYLEGKKSAVRARETNLTKLATTAILNECKADIVLVNGGSFRDSIDIGDITRNEIITVFPFGNYIITKAVTGENLIAALELGFSDYPQVAAKLPQIAGIQCVIDSTAPAGSRVKSVTINSKPIDLKKEYVLATNDFVANGGDGYDMIKNSKEINQYSGLDEIMCSYISGVTPITDKLIQSLSDRVIIK